METIFLPVKFLADWLTYSIFSISDNTRLGAAINFFIYDTVKILILLFVIIYVVSVIRTFLPQQKIRKLLSNRYGFTGNILAALLGIITPFCTCSAVPLFLGFIEAGVPLGVTFSFLVASPMINEIALVLLFGMFGFKVALLYIISGLTIAIISGVIIGKLKVEHLLEETDTKQVKKGNSIEVSWRERFKYGKDYSIHIIKKVWLYVIIGIGIGAWIHGYVPVDFLAKYAGSDKWYAVPLATLIGIPLYSNAAGIVPLISALTEKGVAMGTTLAFMMAVTGLSLPEFMILKKVMKTKLILIFAAVVGSGILVTGYIFNFVLR